MPQDSVTPSLPTQKMSLSLVAIQDYTQPIIIFPIHKPMALIQRLNNSLPPSLSLPANLLPHIITDPNDSTRARSLRYELIYIGYCINHTDSKTKDGVVGFRVSKIVSVVGKKEKAEDKEKGRLIKSFAPGISLWGDLRQAVKEGVLGVYWTMDWWRTEHGLLYNGILRKLGQ